MMRDLPFHFLIFNFLIFFGSESISLPNIKKQYKVKKYRSINKQNRTCQTSPKDLTNSKGPSPRIQQQKTQHLPLSIPTNTNPHHQPTDASLLQHPTTSTCPNTTTHTRTKNHVKEARGIPRATLPTKADNEKVVVLNTRADGNTGTLHTISKYHNKLRFEAVADLSRDEQGGTSIGV